MSVERSGAAGPRSAAADAANPWPGLAPFTEAQSAQFFGRDAEVKTLARRAQGDPLTVLFGQSGLGKSSLLQAGVFPRLRSADFCPIYVRLDHAPGAPALAEQVKQVLKAETARAGTWTHPEREQPGESLWEFFHHRDNRLVSPGGITLAPVLVFDQFEELFTLGAGGGAERQRAVAFMTELAELVENRPPESLNARLEEAPEVLDAFDFDRADYRVIISLREDFLPHLEGLKTIMPTLMDNRLRLSRMNGVQALEAVVKPGAGLVSEDVARAIVEFVSGARGGSTERLAELDVEPPLLSVICRELNERRRALGQAQITADLVTGNRREILNDFYERSVADLPEAMRAFVEDHLLTKSGFRDNLSLESALEFPGVTQPLIDTLVSRRLLRVEDRLGVQRVELTHDVLAEVIRAARDDRQRRQALALAARAAHRQRFAIGALAAAVVGLCIGAFFGIRAQRRSAEQAARSDLLLGSRLLDEGKVADGLSYLVSAARKDPGNDLIAPRLLSTLTARNFTLPAGKPLALPSPVLSAAMFADGRLVVVQSEDDSVRLIDTGEWRVVREYRFERKVLRGGVRTAERSADVIAFVLDDRSILVCDTATGRPRFPAIKPPTKPEDESTAGAAAVMRLSADGKWLARFGGGLLLLVDTTTGAQTTVANCYVLYSWAGFQPFSPDGRWIAATHVVFSTNASGVRSWESSESRIVSVPDGRTLVTLKSPVTARMVFGISVSADGRRLLALGQGLAADTGDTRTAAQVYDTATGEPASQAVVTGTSSTYSNDIWLTPDGTRLIHTTDSREATVYEMATGKPAYPPLAHGGPVYGVGISSDSRVLVTNSVDGYFRLWDLAMGKLAAEPTFRQERFAAVAASPEARTVAVFTAAGSAYKLRLTAGAAAPLELPRVTGAAQMVQFVAQPPARLLWLTSSEARAIDVATGRETTGGFKFPGKVASFTRRPYGATLDPGEVLVARFDSSPPRLWVMGENGVAQDVAWADDVSQTGIAISSSARRIAARFPASGPNRAVVVWDSATGQRAATIKTEQPVAAFDANAAPFSPDDRRLALRMAEGNGAVIEVYDLAEARPLCSLRLSGRAVFRTHRFSPDGRHLLTGDSWGTVQVWDAANGKLLHSTQAHRTVVSRFDFSADGRYYASLSTDGSVQVWEMATHTPVGAPMVQTGAPARVFFSPDSTRIVTPSRGGTTRVWDVATGLPLNDAMDHEGGNVSVVSYSPGGKYISTQATAGPHQMQRVWAAPPPGGTRTPKWLLELATICAGQRLTDEGKVVGVTEDYARMDELRREIAALPASDPYGQWAQWFLSEGPNRPIAPGFTITPAEAKKLRAQFAAEVPVIRPSAAVPKGGKQKRK